jgi:hypothetical protein
MASVKYEYCLLMVDVFTHDKNVPDIETVIVEKNLKTNKQLNWAIDQIKNIRYNVFVNSKKRTLKWVLENHAELLL